MNLDQIRSTLEEELKDVLGTSGRLRDHLRNKDRTLPADWAELAQFVENDEVLEHLEVRSRERLVALQTAIARIDEGTYTRCANCGATISPERLELLPTTTVCVRCAP